jgi:hypothetical protein
MKTIPKLMVVLFLAGFLFACSNKEKIYDNICHGMYDGLQQQQDLKNTESVPPPWKEQPTYEQYKREREESQQNPDETSLR